MLDINQYKTSIVTALGGVVVGALLVFSLGHTSSQTIYTVDVNSIIGAYIKSSSKHHSDLNDGKRAVEAFSRQLDSILNDIARHDKAIILPQQAVFAGAKDITSIVRRRMETPNA